MQTSYSLLVSVLLPSLILSAPIPRDHPKAAFYHPTEVGTKWIYACDDHDEVQVVTAVEDKPEGKFVSIGREKNGKVVPLRQVLVSEKGVWQLTSEETKFDPPLCVLKLPAKPGDKWERKPQVGLTELKGTATILEKEQVDVPAGKYTALKVGWEYRNEGQELQHATFWYEASVGLVKMKMGDTVVVLKSFVPVNKK